AAEGTEGSAVQVCFAQCGGGGRQFGVGEFAGRGFGAAGFGDRVQVAGQAAGTSGIDESGDLVAQPLTQHSTPPRRSDLPPPSWSARFPARAADRSAPGQPLGSGEGVLDVAELVAGDVVGPVLVERAD